MSLSVIALPANRPHASRPFFAIATGREFQSRTANDATVIDLFDEIGPFGISESDVDAHLKGAGDVVLRINSPGGDVFSGIAIFNLLAAHQGRVRVEILGLAASAASLIAMAGDEIAIAENAFLMLHRAWGATIGNEAAHEESAALLRQLDLGMTATYAARTGEPQAKIKAMLEAETWLSADAALAAGFATEKLAAASTKARFDLSIYAKAPTELNAAIDRSNSTIRDVEIALRDAGYSRSQASALAARGHHGDAEQQRDAAEIASLAAHIDAAFPNTI